MTTPEALRCSGLGMPCGSWRTCSPRSLVIFIHHYSRGNRICLPVPPPVPATIPWDHREVTFLTFFFLLLKNNTYNYASFIRECIFTRFCKCHLGLLKCLNKWIQSWHFLFQTPQQRTWRIYWEIFEFNTNLHCQNQKWSKSLLSNTILIHSTGNSEANFALEQKCTTVTPPNSEIICG